MNIYAMVIRIIRQFLHDKRSLALLFIAPLFILLLMSLVFNGETVAFKIGTFEAPEMIVKALRDQGAEVEVYMSLEKGQQALEDSHIDALVRFGSSTPEILLEGSDPSENRALLVLLQNTMQPQAGAKAKIEYLHGSSDMTPFDSFGPVLVGTFSYFFVFLLAGISFLRERTGGTLERLMASPIRRGEVVVGYLCGFGVFAIVQSVLIAWFAIDILDMMMNGSFLLVILITIILALNALTLGTFLSAYASNEFQMVQFIPLVIVPQIFFSGLFNLDTIVGWLRPISYVMPLYYGADAMRAVMVRGEGWTEVAPNVAVLLLMSFVFATVNILVLRKHRQV